MPFPPSCDRNGKSTDAQLGGPGGHVTGCRAWIQQRKQEEGVI